VTKYISQDASVNIGESSKFPQPGAIVPLYIKFPPPGKVEPYTNTKRSFLYSLAARGLIRVVKLKQKGKARGSSWIVASSLFDLLDRLEKEQNPSSAATAQQAPSAIEGGA